VSSWKKWLQLKGGRFLGDGRASQERVENRKRGRVAGGGRREGGQLERGENEEGRGEGGVGRDEFKERPSAGYAKGGHDEPRFRNKKRVKEVHGRKLSDESKRSQRPSGPVCCSKVFRVRKTDRKSRTYQKRSRKSSKGGVIVRGKKCRRVHTLRGGMRRPGSLGGP